MVFLSQNKMFGILNDQIINYLLSENMVNKFNFFRYFLCKCGGVKDIKRSRIAYNQTIPKSEGIYQ